MKELIFNIEGLLNILVLSSLLVISFCLILSKNLLNVIILFSVFSMLMAAEYIILKAPDVAITEASVSVGISTVLLLLALFLVGDKEKKNSRKIIMPFLLVSVLAVALLYSISNMPVFGAMNTPANSHIAQYYITNTEAEIGIPNMVTAILASYRGYDTFGETIVIFTAALSVLIILSKKLRATTTPMKQK